MNSIYNSFHREKSLPLSSNNVTKSKQDVNPAASMRRRLSSLSLNIQPPSMLTTTTSWALRRSKSVSAMGENAGVSVKNWWGWGWDWIMSKKPGFAQDLEMNQVETVKLGCHNKGSWRHVFFKVTTELRKLIGFDNDGLPQTVKYETSYNGGSRRKMAEL